MSSRTAPSLLRRLSSPVRNRQGGFSPTKTAIFTLLFFPGLWLAWRYQAGELGARPVLALVHSTGIWALRLVVITLALTPARLLLQWSHLSLLRRMIGVASACYALLHLMLYIAQQNWHLVHVAAEILHRLYLTIGLVALAALSALAATSTDAMMRRLGRNWKRLHSLIYPAAVLGLLHFFMQAKAEVFQAVIVAGLFVWLMAWRRLPPAWRGKLAAVLALGVVATVAAAAIEYAWFAVATHVNATRVLQANFRFAHWRPSVYVALWGAGTAAVVLALKAWPAALSRRTSGRQVPHPQP